MHHARFQALSTEIQLDRDCSHPSGAWVRVATRQGGYEVRRQCQDCGQVEETVRTPRAGDGQIAWVDQALAATYESNNLERSTRRARNKIAWRKLFQDYVESQEWKNRTGLVMRRNLDACEGCYHPAVTVIHRSFENVGNEPLWDLAAVCRNCEKKYSRDPWEEKPGAAV